jgi:hypothetical protein
MNSEYSQPRVRSFSVHRILIDFFKLPKLKWFGRTGDCGMEFIIAGS